MRLWRPYAAVAAYAAAVAAVAAYAAAAAAGASISSVGAAATAVTALFTGWVPSNLLFRNVRPNRRSERRLHVSASHILRMRLLGMRMRV